jgi:2-oxoisovalerate dehydrogenase E1 component
MSLERVHRLVARFREEVSRTRTAPPSPRAEARLDARLARELLESMLLARHLDVAAHELRATGHGHYTICSAGHEANVVLGRLTRPTDPALVHYRSAALLVERARHAPGVDAVGDVVLSLVASSDEPASGGRHKVFGSKALGVIPKTSTIASHLPRAVGLGVALERRARLGLEPEAPRDAIALASFGDASVNHSTAEGALNAAGWVVHQKLTLPVLFVCEDNGLGISVRSPTGWIAERLGALPHVEYFHADGSNLAQSWRAAEAAVLHCRGARRPAILHLECVRLLGHAGSDVDTAYRTPGEIDEALARDPVTRAALDLIASGVLGADDVLELDAQCEARVRRASERALSRPKLTTRAEVMQAIAPAPGREMREEAARDLRPLGGERMTLAQGINSVLGEALERYPEALIFGEDVAKKGGVYGVTKGLLSKGGAARVFNTLLDEQTILGLALGAGTLGMLPIPEIQYLAYLHNAEDQLRGEAATMQFFSNGAYSNPMLVRIAGLAYQKGFGGHFHNDHSLAVLRDVPGLVLGVPARADDAIAMYRTGFALARADGRVVVMVEPIALYHTRDLHEPGDDQWLAAPPLDAAPFGRARVYRAQAGDLTIATFGNGVALSLKAARALEHEDGIRARVLDLRWLAPLPLEDVLAHARETGRLLFVDECRRSGSVSEAVATAVFDARPGFAFARVTAPDSFIPLGDAANLVLIDEREIVEAARRMCRS